MTMRGYYLGQHSGCVYGIVVDEEDDGAQGGAKAALKNALKEAYENVGYDPDKVAEYLFTATFRRLPRKPRYNALLHAGNAVGINLPVLMQRLIEATPALIPDGSAEDGARLMRELVLAPFDALGQRVAAAVDEERNEAVAKPESSA